MDNEDDFYGSDDGGNSSDEEYDPNRRPVYRSVATAQAPRAIGGNGPVNPGPRGNLRGGPSTTGATTYNISMAANSSSGMMGGGGGGSGGGAAVNTSQYSQAEQHHPYGSSHQQQGPAHPHLQLDLHAAAAAAGGGATTAVDASGEEFEMPPQPPPLFSAVSLGSDSGSEDEVDEEEERTRCRMEAMEQARVNLRCMRPECSLDPMMVVPPRLTRQKVRVCARVLLYTGAAGPEVGTMRTATSASDQHFA
mmetsp:Transcript_103084/g.295710  ORF Transcript_103084/g.295710 Transcript_103084/m.295710 type:complete len:250 (-) Transcript_103084:522-1271(-)